MPRQDRLDVAGALHHIILRGIEKRRIFDGPLCKGSGLGISLLTSCCFGRQNENMKITKSDPI